MSSAKIEKVVVAGVNGALGESVIKHLLTASFTVTALTTNPRKTYDTYGDEVTLVEADYADPASLVPKLKGQDAVVSLINRSSSDSQNTLLDAAIEAGVRHFIPSCFGGNTQIPDIRASPFNQSKIETEDYLMKRANEGRIVYTIIQTSIFFEWAIGKGVVVNPQGPTFLFDQSDVEFSTTSVDDVGKAVVNALRKSGTPEVDNKFLLMHSTVLTQNKALKIAGELRPEIEWKTIPVDTKRAWEGAQQAYSEGRRDMQTMMGLLARPMFGTGQGLFRPNDNEVLGIREWIDKETREHFERLLSMS